MELSKGILFHNRYLLVSLLGTGASAQVWKAKDTKANNLLVALKIFSESSGMNSYGLQSFEKQFTIVFNMKQSNLLPPTGYDIYQGCPYLIMQYCENGSCTSMAGRMEEDDIIKFLHDVSAGLEYLHDHNIIHQDIKPDNIMLDDNCNFMVTDFGISVSANGSVYDSQGMSGGTRAYMGPERFEGTTVPASDMWSLGASMVELITGNPPYGDHGGLLQAQGEALPQLPSDLQPEVRSMILSCLHPDPNHRIKANEIRQKIDLYWETGSWTKPSQKKTIAIALTAVASVLLCLGIFLWDYNRPKIYYYKDYVERWGVPEGVGRVSSWSMKHMHRLYKFEYKQGKVRRVSHINSLGVIIQDGESERNERPIDQDIYYTSEGKVSRIKVRDNNGKVLYVKAYNENLTTMSFQYDDQHNTERALSAQTVGYGRMLEDENSQKGKITRWLLDYTDDGLVERIRYAGLDNTPVNDDNNLFGRRMVYDDKGRITEIHYIGNDNNPHSTKWGLGIKKFYYDDKDNWVKAAYYTVDNETAYDDVDGVAIYEMEYDDKGNVIYTYHKDGNGELMLPKKSGIAGLEAVYDDKGFLTKQTFIGTDKKPIYVPSEGYAGYTAKYDENGFITEEEFFDPDGNICESSQGNSKLILVNDQKGNILELWRYNKAGELCLDQDGLAGHTCKYDSLGNMMEIIYYGKDKKPILDKDGEAGYRYKYDDRNLTIELMSLGVDLTPTFNNNHTCIVRFEHDKRGNTTKIAFYDASGTKLEESNEHVAGWNISYDDLGNETERSFFNTHNALCEVAGGYARKVMTYDNRGHIKTERFFNVSGNLTAVNGIAGTDYTSDESGNIIVEKPVGVNGGLAPGRFETHRKYDKFGNCVEESYFANGSPTVCRYGYHRETHTFNARNQIVEVCYYDKDSRLTISSNENIAKQRNEYNNRGDRVKTFYYGVDGKPAVGREGWALSAYEYDNHGNIIKQSFFAIDGKPTDSKVMVPVGICKYDIHNNMIYLAAQDGKGKFIINPNTGWAITRMEYDNKSQLLSQAYFNESDKPMNGKEGYHKYKAKYDVNGNEIEKSYWGVDGKPTLQNGYHIEKSTYDNRGNLTLYAFYDKDGKPTDCSYGFHKMVITYYNGTPVSRKYYTAGNRLLATQSYNKAKAEWNSLQGTGSVSYSSYSPKSSSSDWRNGVSSANNECPVKVSDGVYIQSLTYSGNNVIMTIKLSDVSKYDMDDDMSSKMQVVSSELKQYLRQALNLPSNVSVIVKYIDKANRAI